MLVIYRPFLKAKPGEFEAVTNLSDQVHRHMEPTYVISPPKAPKLLKNKGQQQVKSIAGHIAEVAQGIASTRPGMSAAFDLAETWKPNAKTEHGEHVLTHLQSALERAGVMANPVVAYDRWPDEEYQIALRGMHLPDGRQYILRFGSYAIEDMADSDYFQVEVEGILTRLGARAAACVGIIDLGDLSGEALDELVEKAQNAAGLLHRIGFRSIVLAGCSLPPTIDKAVSQPDTSGLVLRREMVLWQTLRKSGHAVIFGDYGVRNPRSPDDVPNPYTNAKIRYTTDLNFYIERGHSMKGGLKGEQYRNLARNVMRSRYYVREEFSWGDAQIVQCATRESIVGLKSSTKWIAFDTNHHCHAVLSEVAEFQMHLARRGVTP